MNVETASRLVALRKRAGMSQEELADKIGVSRQAVSKWERAESSPDTDNLIALARMYGVKVDDMLNQDVSPNYDIEASGNEQGRQINWASFPYPIIVTIFFFLILFDVVVVPFPAWLVFLTIPIWGFFFTKGKGDKKSHGEESSTATEKKSSRDDWMND